MAKEIYLTQYGLMAERHWREFRPENGARTGGEGHVDGSTLRSAGANIGEMEALTRELETKQKLTPQQAHDRAWEMIREKYILLPPEENL